MEEWTYGYGIAWENEMGISSVFRRTGGKPLVWPWSFRHEKWSGGYLLAKIRFKLDEMSSTTPGFRAVCRELLDRPAILTAPNSSIIQTALKLKRQDTQDCHGVSYYTDASVLNPTSKIPTLIYGPGNEKLAHQPNEWVDVDAYLRSITFYKELAIRFLGEK